MKEEIYYIVIFKSKNYTMQIFSMLEKLGYRKFELIPTPISIGIGCNYSIKFKNLKDLLIVKDAAYNMDVQIKNLYSIEKKDGRKIIQDKSHLI